MVTKFSLTALNGKLFNLSNLIFLGSLGEKWKYNALFTKTAEHYNYNVNNETSNVFQHGFHWTTRRISHNNWRNDTWQMATKRVPLKVLFVGKKARRNFLQ